MAPPSTTGLPAGHDELGRRHRELDRARPVGREIADARRESDAHLVAGQEAGPDPERRAHVLEDSRRWRGGRCRWRSPGKKPPAGTAPGWRRSERLPAVLHQREHAAGALHAPLTTLHAHPGRARALAALGGDDAAAPCTASRLCWLACRNSTATRICRDDCAAAGTQGPEQHDHGNEPAHAAFSHADGTRLAHSVPGPDMRTRWKWLIGLAATLVFIAADRGLPRGRADTARHRAADERPPEGLHGAHRPAGFHPLASDRLLRRRVHPGRASRSCRPAHSSAERQRAVGRAGPPPRGRRLPDRHPGDLCGSTAPRGGGEGSRPR